MKKKTASQKARFFAKKFPFVINPEGKLFCSYCSTIVRCDKKFSVDVHRLSKKHVQTQSI